MTEKVLHGSVPGESSNCESKRGSRIWLFAHSPPVKYADIIDCVLDPRHPTRHSIWTSVADYLQERVFDIWPQLRLDVKKLRFENAFASANNVQENLNFNSNEGQNARISLSQEFRQFRPPVVFTFGDEVYRFVSCANSSNQHVLETRLTISELGERFRESCKSFDPNSANIFPLLHASVARASWDKVGDMFSGPENNRNYFMYVGQKLGDVLLQYGREWPIWRNKV